jgi:hypothetical protein
MILIRHNVVVRGVAADTYDETVCPSSIRPLIDVVPCNRYHAVSCKRVEDAAIPPDRALVVQQRLLTMGELINIEEFFTGWFQGADFASIKQGNVEEFIAYGFFCDHFAKLKQEVGRKFSVVVGQHSGRQLLGSFCCDV